MPQKIPPMQFTRAAYNDEKARLKADGHVFDAKEFDQFFSAATGNPNVIRTVWEAMRKSPNPTAAARQRQMESMGDKCAAKMEIFSALGENFGALD